MQIQQVHGHLVVDVLHLAVVLDDAGEIAIDHVADTGLLADTHHGGGIHHAAALLIFELLFDGSHLAHVDEAELAGAQQLGADGVGDGLGIDMLGGLVADGIHVHHRAPPRSDLAGGGWGQQGIRHLVGDGLQIGGAVIDGDRLGFGRIAIADGGAGAAAQEQGAGQYQQGMIHFHQ